MNKVLILLDADVIIHLFKANKISILNILFTDRLRVLDVVLNELKKNRTIRENIDSIVLFGKIIEIPFTLANISIAAEYVKLKSTILGDGERATLIFCKHNQHVIASSNTKDILPFCNQNSIAFLTTLDILTIAVRKGQMSETEANDCIKKITFNNESYLVCDNINDYCDKFFDSVKLSY